MLEKTETVYSDTKDVACDGATHGAGPGHPLVYLEMGDSDEVVCPYCSRRFVLGGHQSMVSGH